MLNAAAHLPELSRSQFIARGKKLQAPSSNIQRSSKLQTSGMHHNFWSLEFEVSLELGCWSLVLSFFLHPDLRAEFLDLAVRAVRVARIAAAAAMPDQPVADQRPVLRSEERRVGKERRTRR